MPAQNETELNIINRWKKELLVSSIIKAAEIPPRFSLKPSWSDLKGPQPYLSAISSLKHALDSKYPSIILITGTRGTGKTQAACTAILEYAQLCKSGAYTTLTELVADLKSRLSRNHNCSLCNCSPNGELSWIRKWSSFHLLAIDEFSSKTCSEYESELVEALIDKRYAHLKPTIIIANSSPELTTTNLKPSIIDRSREGGGAILFSGWQSFRANRPS